MSNDPKLTCELCPAFFPLEEQNGPEPFDGQCRLKNPVAQLIPQRMISGDGLGLHGLYPPVKSDNWCMNHPNRANFMIPPVPLTWSKEEGFNRAPTLAEAMAFKPGEEGDKVRAALIERSTCEGCE